MAREEKNAAPQDELLSAYADALNQKAEYLGHGGSHLSEECKEIERTIQSHEHLIAQRALTLSGWEMKPVYMYHKKTPEV